MRKYIKSFGSRVKSISPAAHLLYLQWMRCWFESAMGCAVCHFKADFGIEIWGSAQAREADRVTNGYNSVHHALSSSSWPCCLAE